MLEMMLAYNFIHSFVHSFKIDIHYLVSNLIFAFILTWLDLPFARREYEPFGNNINMKRKNNESCLNREEADDEDEDEDDGQQ